MSEPIPTAAQIRAQVATVHEKVPDARVIGIRARLPLDLGTSLRVNDRQYDVAACRSALEVRDRLIQVAEGPPLVLLTELPETELGTDVLARLARRHLHAIDPWLLVRQRFHARHVDPRLVRQQPWVATALLEAEPSGGFPPAPSGFLHADAAWRVLFESLLELPGGERDPQSLLAWGLDPHAPRRLAALDETIRKGLADAVENSAGAAGRSIFECLAGPLGERALAVGLVARVLFDASGDGDGGADAVRAQGRLDTLLGGTHLDADIALSWASAAESLVRERLQAGQGSAVQPLLAAADGFLEELGAAASAHRSTFLATGFTQRLTVLADALSSFAKGRAKRVPPALDRAVDTALEHVLATHDQARTERTEMALRLARWIAARRSADAPEDASFSRSAARYMANGGFVDRARTHLRDGDPVPALANAYGDLLSVVDRAREDDNERFGTLFARWCTTGSHDPTLMPVESVLDRVVVPLAAQAPVLFIVMDGMSHAVYRELQDDLGARGWVELIGEQEATAFPVIAAVPTVTEVCRASLLCGRLTTGAAPTETAGFASHAGLVAAGRANRPPALFHKGALRVAGTPGLAPDVRAALADEGQRVVGVVVNAVDDHLAKGEQVRVDWAIRSVRPLGDLLAHARDAGRVVVLVSDHGHVSEHHTESRPGTEAERWREANSPAGAGELAVEGPRVLLGAGNRLVAPWSERLRYGAKKNGYHGGISPQEVMIPLGVFAGPGMEVDGWREAPPDWPEWWDGPAEQPQARRAGAKARRKSATPKAPAEAAGQGVLFPSAAEASEPSTPVSDAPEEAPAWIGELLTAETFASQRRAAARTALSDERIKAVLAALDERGGKITRGALARSLGVPQMRVGGIVSALRRMLNVDGYDVLSVDEASDSVTLNRELLDIQFGLRAG